MAITPYFQELYKRFRSPISLVAALVAFVSALIALKPIGAAAVTALVSVPLAALFAGALIMEVQENLRLREERDQLTSKLGEHDVSAAKAECFVCYLDFYWDTIRALCAVTSEQVGCLTRAGSDVTRPVDERLPDGVTADLKAPALLSEAESWVLDSIALLVHHEARMAIYYLHDNKLVPAAYRQWIRPEILDDRTVRGRAILNHIANLHHSILPDIHDLQSDRDFKAVQMVADTDSFKSFAMLPLIIGPPLRNNETSTTAEGIGCILVEVRAKDGVREKLLTYLQTLADVIALMKQAVSNPKA